MTRSITALFVLSSFALGGVAQAQAPIGRDPQIASLMRQEAALRDRIGRMQLDALLARVDRTMVHKLPAQSTVSSAERRDLALYSY